jgi:hypothetical protein
LVNQGRGSVLKTKEGKYLVYLPKYLVEDTNFPFPMTKSRRVKISFKRGEKRIVVEEL